ncbi:MAG: hypothetical protein Q9168_006810, partial [Polycauliona sp. 1 TL-2023]
MQALLLEGFDKEDTQIRRGLDRLETWMWEDDNGKRIQLSNSPVWDTSLMIQALCKSDPEKHRNDPRVQSAASWCKANQIIGANTDLAQYLPSIPTGCFAFQYDNPWYPDVDDTAAVALSLYLQDPHAFEKFPLIRATEFILAMQNADGGWSAFDRDNNPEWLHKSPFSDMDNLCDPSSADITGRVLQLCGLAIRASEVPPSPTTTHNRANGRPPPDLVANARCASTRAISYLCRHQEGDGSWWGRWGSNYVFATSIVIEGLALFAESEFDPAASELNNIKIMIHRGAAFLAGVQHPDGGWGESYAT